MKVEMDTDTAQTHGHEKRPLLRAIRAKCMDCCVQQQAEVARCVSYSCDLWPYRMGSNPFHSRKGLTGAAARREQDNG